VRQRIKPFWIIIVLWIVAWLVVNPIGNFPLNDDWAYALSVKNWLDTGQFEIIDWPAMSLFTHVAWGTFWSLLFGFSFTVLRLAIFLLAVFSIWVFSLIIKQLDFSWEQQLVALAVIVFNPMYFHLSNTFMTDVSFLSFCILSSYGFLRYFTSEKWYWWVIAIFCSVCAILVRQLGLLIPIAFGGAMLLRKVSIRSSLAALTGVLITFGSLKGYLWCLENSTGLPPSFASIESVLESMSPSSVWKKTKRQLGFYFIYTGGYLLPLWLYTTKSFAGRNYLIFFMSCLPILGFFTFPCWDRLPLWNTVYNYGIGPMTLPDFIKGYSKITVLSNELFVFIKLTGFLGAILLLWNAVQSAKRLWPFQNDKPPLYYFRLGVLFFLISFVFYLIIDKYNFDRYLLPLIPFTILLFSRSERKVLLPAVMILAPLVFFAVGGTHDYLAWNKARWKGLADLEARGIKPSEIDGGFEYNGWHQTHHLNPDNQYSKSWWFVDNDRYALAFTSYKNYKVIAAYPFTKYLTFEKDSVLVLERAAYTKTTKLSQSEIPPRDSLFINYNKEDYLLSELPEDLEISKPANVLYLKPEQKYGLDYKLFPIQPYEKISISFDLHGDKNAFVVVTSAPDEEVFYYAHKPYVLERNKTGWQKTVIEMELPADYPSDTMHIYFWKKHENKALFIRDLELEWTRY